MQCNCALLGAQHCACDTDTHVLKCSKMHRLTCTCVNLIVPKQPIRIMLHIVVMPAGVLCCDLDLEGAGGSCITVQKAFIKFILTE